MLKRQVYTPAQFERLSKWAARAESGAAMEHFWSPSDAAFLSRYTSAVTSEVGACAARCGISTAFHDLGQPRQDGWCPNGRTLTLHICLPFREISQAIGATYMGVSTKWFDSRQSYLFQYSFIPRISQAIGANFVGVSTNELPARRTISSSTVSFREISEPIGLMVGSVTCAFKSCLVCLEAGRSGMYALPS